jgi:PAS domain S-box-containing protein
MSNEEKERDKLHSELTLLNKILSTLIDGKNRRIQGGSLAGVERDFIDVVLIMCFNRACEEATGFSSKEIIGKYVWDLSPTEEDAQKVREEFHRLRIGQSANRFETFWVKKGGSKRLITWENTVLSEAKSKEGYIIGMGIDITGHRKLEENLRESEEKYRKLVETANDAIFIADAETGIILDVNEKAGELLGLLPEKIIGMRQHQLHPREEALKYRAIFEE